MAPSNKRPSAQPADFIWAIDPRKEKKKKTCHTWRRGCAWAATVARWLEVSWPMRRQRRRRDALGRHGSRCAGGVLAVASCDAREGDGAGCADDGGCCGEDGDAAAMRRADRSGAAAWIPFVGRCRSNRGSPGTSSCRSPRPPDQRHPLGKKSEEEIERY